MNRDKARAGIYSLAAFYMLYTAMQLYKENATGNIAPVVFFVVAAVGLICFALKIAKQVTTEEKKLSEEKKDDESETTGEGMD